MTTTMVVQTDHDVERAVAPAGHDPPRDFPISVLLFSTRVLRSLRSFHRSLTLLRVIKFSVGALVGTLSLISAWWALDLAMWTSVKDFRDDCREQLQSFNSTSPFCQEALSRPLRAPPTWREYLEKASFNLPLGTRYLPIRDSDGAETASSHPRRQLASKSSTRGQPPTSHDEVEFFYDFRMTGIRKQSDPTIMYGGLPRYLPGQLRVFYPLEETRQEMFDDMWEYYQMDCICDIWANTTSTGSVQDIQILSIPDQQAEPEAFDRVLSLMPPSMQSMRREWCTYPSVPDYVHATGWASTMADYYTKIDYGVVLAFTFVLVAYSHEMVYGGFARKTRWKWQ